MKAIFHLFILAILQRIISAFNCPDIPNETKCSYLSAYNCAWSGTACTGSLSTICTGCYFVDPVAGSTTAAGTVAAPVKTLNNAYTKAGSTTATIYILNHRDTTDVTQPTAATISGTLTVQPLFPGSWTLNFSQLPEPTVFLSVTAIKVNKYFYLKGAIISYNFTGFVGSTFLFDIATTGNLTLDTVRFVYSDMGTTSGFAVRITGTAANANFTMLGGSIYESNLKFSLLRGNSYLRDVKTKVSKASTGLFISSGSVITVDNMYVNYTGLGQANSFVLFSNLANGTIKVKNSKMENSNIVLAIGSNSRGIEITNCVFQYITTTDNYFMSFTAVSTVDSYGTSFIKDTTFQNMSVSHSLVMIQKNSVQMTFTNVRMQNISKYEKNAVADVQIEAQWPGGLCALTASDAILTVQSSFFINISSHCFGTQATTLTFNDNLFDNSALVTSSTPFTSTLVSAMTDNTGVSWISINDIRKIDATKYQAVFQRNTFNYNAFPSKYGGAIRFTGVSAAQIYAVSNIFTGNAAAYGGAIYADNKFLSFNFSDNTFTSNWAYDGGAVYKVSTDSSYKSYIPSVYFSGDQFISNSAKRNGGAAYLDWESFKLENALFDTNQAMNGGGIYFLTLDTQNNVNTGSVSGSTFTNNYASNIGGAMKIFFNYVNLHENATSATVFSNNYDSFSNQSVSEGRPSYYVFSFYDVIVEKTFSELDNLQNWTTNATRTKLASRWNTTESGMVTINQKSGHEVTQIIEIEVYDDNDQPVNYITNERVIVQITSTSDSSSGFNAYLVASPVYLSFEQGTIYIKTDLKIIGEPLSNAVLNFQGVDSSSNMLKSLSLLMNTNLQVSFTDCETGDIYDNTTKTCDTCASGTYTLDNPYDDNAQCYQCDTTSQLCLGGSKVSPQPGYWRYDPAYPSVLPCPEKSACLGGFVNEIYYPNGKCEFPYQGNLCSSCATNYAKFGSDETCSNCKKEGSYYIKFMAFFLLRIGAMVYSIKVNLNKISGTKKKIQKAKTMGGGERESNKITNEDFQSNLMKIVVNFLQVSTIIFQYKFDWPDFIARVINITNKFIPISSDGFSIDCIVALASQSSSSIYFIKLVVTLLEPFAIWLALVGAYVLYLKFKRETIKGNPKVRKNVVVLFVITAFIQQPSLIQATLELFKCSNLRTADDTAYFMTKDADVQCWTAKHITWSVGVALPFFILWGILLPVVLFRKLKAKAGSLHDTEVFAKYSFVFEGLKKKRYYWEFVTLIRKTLIIFIFVFFNVISIQLQAFATFLVILIFTGLQIKFRPYANRNLNKLELLSLVALLVMAYSGMFFLSGGSTDGITMLLIVISMIGNIAFFATIAFFFIKSYRKIAQKMARSVTKKVKSTLDRSKSRSNSSSRSRRSSSDSNSSSDERSSKVSNEIRDMEEIIEAIQIDSPKNSNNQGNSNSNLSDIPMETDEDTPSTTKKQIVYNGGSPDASLNQSSIVRNFGFKQQQSFHHQNSLSVSQSANGSMLGLLNQLQSPQSSSRRPLNLNIKIDSGSFLKPRPMNESGDFRKSPREQLDSPLGLKNLGISYEDSPRMSSSRPMRVYNDDSLMLKIPISASESLKLEPGSETQR